MKKVICPGCGKRTATEHVLSKYRFIESGLPGITLHGGAVETTCSECDEKYYHVRREGQVLQLIALTVLTGPNHLLGPELRYVRGVCQLRQHQLARILKCRRATVAEREAARKSRMSDAERVWVRLVLLHEFRKHLEGAANHNFLSPSQMARLDAFEREFSRRALELANGPAASHSQELQMLADGTWELADAA